MLFRYISGNNLNKALVKASIIYSKNKIPIINFAIEKNYPKELIKKEFYNIADSIDNTSKVSLKLSLFDYDKTIIYPVISNLVKKNIKVLIDAENHTNYQTYKDLTDEIISEFNKEETNIYKTYQMVRTDSLEELKSDLDKFKNFNLGIKMVRGAYHNEDKNKTNLNNNPVLFQNKLDTDINYNTAILHLHKNHTDQKIILASHNKESINLGYLLNQEKEIFEFAHLMGMGEKNYEELIKNNQKVHVYIPYGPYKYMLPYFIRRLYENLDYIKFML